MRLQAPCDFRDDLFGAPACGIDPQMRRLPIERLPFREHPPDRALGIWRLQQGAVSFLSDPLPNRLGRRRQPNAKSTCTDRGPILRPEHDPAPGGNHLPVPAYRLPQHRRFPIPKRSLALRRKNLRNGPAGRRLDPGVGIDKASPDLAGQELAAGGFSGPHEADENHVHFLPLAKRPRDFDHTGPGATGNRSPMETLILPTDSSEFAREAVARAVALLGMGEVAALPTETVYGLGADALNEEAVAKIFATKERPLFDPLIVHIGRKDWLERVAIIPEEIRSDINRLTHEFWPGALTLILPKQPCIPDIVTAGLPTVAVRVSAHPIFTRIVRSLDRPIAAPSANRFGRISPTSAGAVLEELKGRIPLIVDGGACACGLESTILRVEPAPEGKSKPLFHILRPGPVTPEQLKEFGKIVKPRPGAISGEGESAPQAPGMLPSHYAPATPLRLVETPDAFRPEPGKRYALLSYRGEAKDGFIGLHDWQEVIVLSPGAGKLPEAAVRFFYALRQADRLGVDEIIAEPVTEVGLGVAIMDRLRRASV